MLQMALASRKDDVRFKANSNIRMISEFKTLLLYTNEADALLVDYLFADGWL
mgnify:CR=1 FL=1